MFNGHFFYSNGYIKALCFAPPGLCEAADVSRFLQISKNKKEKWTCVESGVFVIVVIISFS